MKQKIVKISQILSVFLLLSLVIINVYSIANQTVYITKSGSKYHRDGCQYLSRSKIAIDLDTAITRGYTPCSKCNPDYYVISTNTTNNTVNNTYTTNTHSKTITGSSSSTNKSNTNSSVYQTNTKNTTNSSNNKLVKFFKICLCAYIIYIFLSIIKDYRHSKAIKNLAKTNKTNNETYSTTKEVEKTKTNNNNTNSIYRCPQCGGIMKLKSGKYGLFWGCTNYPKCRYTKSYRNK